MHLKLAPPPADEAPPRQWFSFRRSAGKVDAYLNDSEGAYGQHLQSYNRAPTFSSRAEARTWCREFAAKRGIPYAEAPRKKSRVPTISDRNQFHANQLVSWMTSYDREANRTQAAGDWYRAGEYWLRGAAHCQELVSLWPGRAKEIATAGAVRLKNASECLKRASAQMVALGSTRALGVVHNPGGHP